MKLIQLDKKERQEVYDNHLLADFHESEVKPFSMIEKLIQRNEYKCYGFLEGNSLVGYAYLTKAKDSSSLVIDYLAVCSGNRSNGLGSKFIDILKEKFKENYSSILAEVEDPEASTSREDKENRDRRISFYIRNGFSVSGVKTKVLVDDYRIIKLSLQREMTDSEVTEEIRKVYKTIFSEEFYKKHIHVSN